MRAAASRGRAVGIAVGLACAAGPVGAARAAAHAPSHEVRWDAPAECPASAFTEALDRLLASSPVDVPIRVEATVERTADGWSIETDFDAGPERSGRRTFEGLSCRTVTQAAALAIAIAVDPGVLDRWVPMIEAPLVPPVPRIPEPRAAAASEVEPSEVEPQVELGAIEAVPPATAAADAARRDPAARWRGLAGVAGTIDGGALPGPGFGLAATVGVLHLGFRGELVGGYRFATRRAAADDARVGGAFTQWWVGARGCGVPRVGPVELPLCAGLEGGRTIGSGTGLRMPHTSRLPWWAASVEAGVAWPVRPWLALTARATLAVPLLRQDFTIAGLGLVHRLGPVQGRGTLGVELRWP